jgi:hypothetical protein
MASESHISIDLSPQTSGTSNELVRLAEADGATFTRSATGAWWAKDRDGITVSPRCAVSRRGNSPLLRRSQPRAVSEALTMAALSASQIRTFVRVAQDHYRRIDLEDRDEARSRYRTASDTAKWQQAAADVLPREHQEWREIVRVLAQGESYYGGSY